MFTQNFLSQHRLGFDFYQQKTLKVAQNLLGKYLVVVKDNLVRVGQIVETEAYIGTQDQACHAFKGQTPRNKIMWHRGGFAYVYLIYGMYHLLNIITEEEGFPAGVLIRSLKPIQNIDGKTDGPGKICRALEITTKDLGLDLISNSNFFIADLGDKVPKTIRTPRIGIDYAPEPWLSKLWRFTI